MSKFFNNDRPVFREIFLSDENRKLRIILLCVFLGIGVVAIATGISDFLNVDPGWQEVEVIAEGVNCSEDFTLQYYFTDSGAAATAIQKDIISIYSDACHKAYQLFTPEQAFEGVNNIYAINHAPNTELTVDPVLYDAFALLEEYGSRNAFLGPVYQVYDNIFFSQTDDEAAYWDPEKDPESAAFVQQAVTFAQDPQEIRLELLGDNRVMLHVSEDYLQFAQDNEIDAFVDFHWMTNAFIIDYFADLLLEKDYTKGFIVSNDGYTRNLSSGTDFSFNLLARNGKTVYPAGTMVYNTPTNFVFLRDFTITQDDELWYYDYADGATVTSYVDITDGMDKSATSQLIAYSGQQGCARMLMEILPVFVNDSLDTAALADLTQNEIYTIWSEDFTLFHTQKDLRVQTLLDDGKVKYTTQWYE